VLGLFFVLFLIIKFLFMILTWVFPLVLFLVYLLLTAVNFVSIRLESRSKEVLSI
jgi:hypothetical protein